MIFLAPLVTDLGLGGKYTSVFHVMFYHPSHSFPGTDTHSKKVLYFESRLCPRDVEAQTEGNQDLLFSKSSRPRPGGDIQPSRLRQDQDHQ